MTVCISISSPWNCSHENILSWSHTLPFIATMPADTMVWLSTPEAAFLKGRFIWANWDVEELMSMAAEIEKDDLLTLSLRGWPRPGA